MEFYQLIQDAFRGEDTIDTLYEKWLDIAEKARREFVRGPQSYEFISEFIGRNTEFIESARAMFQNLPYASNGYSEGASGEPEEKAA